MKPDLVVDVGNTRIKWGLCFQEVVEQVSSLPPDDPLAWNKQAELWELESGLLWVVANVHPERRNTLLNWVRQRGDRVWLLDSWGLLPLQVALAHPEKVGMDRLLNAVTANQLRRPNSPAIIVDAGSAVTVDLVDAEGVFRGGAISPGFRLMAQALHHYTALLPLITINQIPDPLGTNTPEAMQSGIFWSIVGGIRTLVEHYQKKWPGAELFLTGGDAVLVSSALKKLGLEGIVRPTLTLEGILQTARNHSLDERIP